MKTEIIDIQSYLEDKRICLLGNAKSIFNNKKDIDSYDIVCRINRGLPTEMTKEFTGNRTDVLFTSTRLDYYMLKKFNAKFVVWMTECQNLASEWIKENAYQNPIEDWRYIKSLIPSNKDTSTGLLVINFLTKYINFKSLAIYGFDCFETGTWYHQTKEQPWHSGLVEKDIISSLIANKNNILWIKE